MTRQLILDLLTEPPPTLDNFITGANEPALDALKHCQPGRAVYLWGDSGSGRSHLLRALSATDDTVYVPASQASHLLARLATSEPIGKRLIAIDDIGHLSDDAQASLFSLYNRWRELAAGPHAFALLLAADRPPLTLPVREDLRTRLGWDLVFRLELLSDEQRARALQSQADERGMTLTPEVINWLLTRHARDLSTLSTLLDALDRYSIQQKRHITLPLLKDLLAQASSETPLQTQ